VRRQSSEAIEIRLDGVRKLDNSHVYFTRIQSCFASDSFSTPTLHSPSLHTHTPIHALYHWLHWPPSAIQPPASSQPARTLTISM